MTTYSISRINLFLECPWKHWCKYIANYKPKSDPEHNQYMDRGTVFHTAMEFLAHSDGKMPVDEVEMRTLEAHQHSDFLESAKEAGIRALHRYLRQPGIVDFSRIIETEKGITYPLPNGHEFYGIIDAVMENPDGSITLIDYKTYSKAPVERKLKYSLQANMYMEVFTRLGYNVKNFSFECVNPGDNLRKNQYRYKPIKFTYNPNRGKETFEQFVELVTMLEEHPDIRTYVPSENRPDVYDYLYQVYVGDVVEYLDDFVERNFKKGVDS